MKQNTFKNFFSFSRSERIAIIAIVSVMVILLTIKYLLINNPPKRDYFKHDLDSIIAQREAVLDSVRRADSIEKAAKSSLRVKHSEVEKSSMRKNNNHHQKHNDTTQRGFLHSAPSHSASVEMTSIIDLNTADTTLLQQLPGIGSTFAKRIVEYRTKLGGYCATEQLLEVYGMDSTRYYGIKDYARVDSDFISNRLRINSDAFKILLKHPYLEYEDVKKIVNYREQKGLITSWGQLVKIVGDAINPKLRYYIDYQ